MERFMAESLNNTLRHKSKILKQIFTVFMVVFLVTCTCQVHAQSVYVPVQHEVYDFLKRMEARQLFTDYQDAAKPLSRVQIATALFYIGTTC